MSCLGDEVHEFIMRAEQLCHWLNVKKGFIVKYTVNTEDIQQRLLIADSSVQLKKCTWSKQEMLIFIVSTITFNLPSESTFNQPL